jgi:uncharacterized protein YuzE
VARALKEIEWDGRPGDPVYLRFTTMAVVQTAAYANGEVNVDLDTSGDVVGIEMLSIDPEEFGAVAQIGKKHDLRFDLFLASAKTYPTASKARSRICGDLSRRSGGRRISR